MTKKKEKEFYSEVDQLLDAEEFLESVREGFCGVDDPRAKDNLSYPLVNLLIMILCSVLAGANTIIDIYNYAHLKLNMFQRILKMEEAPSYDVFWWLLTRLNPKQLESSLINSIQSLPDEEKERLIAIDGKHIKGAAKKGNSSSSRLG